MRSRAQPGDLDQQAAMTPCSLELALWRAGWPKVPLWEVVSTCDHAPDRDDFTTRAARRLALARAGLLKPAWTRHAGPAGGRGAERPRGRAPVIDRFGYLQLDTVSVAGARSHALVLLSRLDGFDPALGRGAAQPGRAALRVLGARGVLAADRAVPGLRVPAAASSATTPGGATWSGSTPRSPSELLAPDARERPAALGDMEGHGGQGWWDLKPAKQVATRALVVGGAGDPRAAEFQRTYDLAERVIPERWRSAASCRARRRSRRCSCARSTATAGPRPARSPQTWRLRNRPREIAAALARLAERGAVVRLRSLGDGGAGRDGLDPPGATSSWRRGSSGCARAPTAACCSRPSTRVLWDRAAGRAPVRLRPGARDLQAGRRSASTATTACRCWPASGWWPGSTSRPRPRRGASACSPAASRAATPSGARAPPPAEAVRSALERYSGALALALDGALPT